MIKVERKGGIIRHQNIKIVEDERVGAVGEVREVTGGPFESEGAGEHGPDSEESDCGQGPELVGAAPTEEASL